MAGLFKHMRTIALNQLMNLEQRYELLIGGAGQCKVYIVYSVIITYFN